jgi:4-hydroxy-3-polyprenylbenzoate decarboxylase
LTQHSKRRLVIGISGASGAIYGVRLLSKARELGLETHLVMSNSAKLAASLEGSLTAPEVEALADFAYPSGDLGASIASGSFKTLGMIVAPCSIKSLSEIAYGVTSSLLTRAADVTLKERRRLVLMVRETPLHLGHLRSMTAATEAGAIIMPPAPAFYAKPQSVDDIVNHTVGRALDLFGLDMPGTPRWTGTGA